MSRPVNQRQIASTAGVSVSAVSLALRNHPKVSLKVRRRIRAIAVRLGYKTDPKVAQLMEHLRRARGVRLRSKLAVIIPELTPAQVAHYAPIRQMLNGASAQADEAGYDLDLFHLVSEGMSAKRLRLIMLTRGIQGIFVAPFASGVGRLNFDFTNFAVATAGYSIVDPLLHRACPNYLQMMDETLSWISRMGYQRVGFVLTYNPGGIGHKLFSSSFLYYQHMLPAKQRIPILPKNRISDQTLTAWIKRHKPEVIISSGDIYERLQRLQMPVPTEIKFSSIDLSEMPGGVAGVDHRYDLVGREAIKLIVSQILLNLSGAPTDPKVVMVDSHWRSGSTLPGTPSRRETRTLHPQD